MDTVFYTLEIDTNKEKFQKINDILGVNSDISKDYWCYELVHGDNKLEIKETTVVAHFLNILEGKYEQLSVEGIQRKDITVWIIYEYDNQCNMEFHPEDTKRLGENGIVLCISCYEI
jgi:hypothetical protein